MNDQWVETTLGEAAQFVNGYAFKPADLAGSSLPVIRIKQLLDAAAEIDYTDIEVPERNRIDDGDLIFSWSGTLASKFWDRGPAALNQHLFKVLPRAGSDLGWLHLALDHAVSDLMTKTHGTTMKHVTKKVLESHRVQRPPLPVQRRIVDLMAHLDNHLANLQVEEEALTKARSAALHDAMTGGLAQFPQRDEWEDLTLGESAEFINGFAFKPAHLAGTDLPVIRIKQLLDPSAEVDYTDIEVPQRNLIRDGDLIFSWSGTLASKFWHRGPAALNQHLFKVLPRTGSDLGWLHLALDHSVSELMMKTHGTTMKHVTKKTLESHNVRRPPLAVQRRIVDLMANLDNHLANLKAERDAVEQTRLATVDSLLSGARVVPHSYDSLLSEVA